MEILKLSATQIITGIECEQKLYYLLTLPKPIKQNSYLYVGSMFHEVLATNFRFKVTEGRDLWWDELESIFEKTWNDQKWKADFSKVPEVNAKNNCLDYLRVYHKERCPVLVPRDLDSIEKFLRFKVKKHGQELWVSMKMDLILNSNVIIDHKTSGSSKAWDEWKLKDAGVQAQLYYAGSSANGIDCTGFSFNVVNHERVDVFDIPQDQTRLNWILGKALDMQRALRDNNLFTSKSKYTCRFCDHSTICNSKVE